MAFSLIRGQLVSLRKSNGDPVETISVGVNWGTIQQKGFFGASKTVAVNLDLSVGVFAASDRPLDVVYCSKLVSDCGSIQHSGDDSTGDLNGDDGQDNETIVVDLESLNDRAEQLAFVLNYSGGQDFHGIPHARIRLYEGSPGRIEREYATFDIANDARFSGSVSMIIGKLYKQRGIWKFSAIGEPTRDRTLDQTLKTFARLYRLNPEERPRR